MKFTISNKKDGKVIREITTKRGTPATHESQVRKNNNDVMHGVKLKDILEYLVENHGWDEMGERVNIRCFTSRPSIKSSLHFLRRTPWARDEVEQFYIESVTGKI